MSFANQNAVNNQLRMLQELTCLKSQMNQLETIVVSKSSTGNSAGTTTEITEKLDEIEAIAKDSNAFIHYVYAMLQDMK